MADFKFNCPQCKHSLEVPEDMCGQVVPCPSCNDQIKVPHSAPKPMMAQQSSTAQATIAQQNGAEIIFCTKCGESNIENNFKCTRCGMCLHETVSPQHVVIEDNSAAMRLLLPVGRSGWAIASGYLGLFSVLLVPAPFALLTGILAIGDIRRHPSKHGMGRAIFGIAAGILGTFGLIGLTAAIIAGMN